MRKFTRALAVATSVAAALLCFTGPVAAHTPEAWTITFATYREVDAMCGDVRIRARLSDAELLATKRAQKAAITQIREWNPNLRIEATYGTRAVLRKLTGTPETGCWATKDDVAWGIHDPDTLIVIARPRENATNRWWFPKTDGGGIVLGRATLCGECRGYVWAIGSAYAETTMRNVYVHEWLHPTAAFYRARGAFVPDVHNWDDYNYSDETLAWKRAITAGTLPDRSGDGRADGITHYARERGSPNGR